MKSYSQCGEDLWVLDNVGLKGCAKTFCEVGAHDGRYLSNTLLFEEMGWNGVLVEADPFLAADCWLNRRATTWCCAAGHKISHAEFCVNMMDRGLSGIKAEGRPMQVLAKPLDWLLATAGHPLGVDLLSIDTEGTELDVWQSGGILRPRVVIMEYRTGLLAPNDAAILKVMERDGYYEAHRTDFNLIFVKK